MLTLISPAKSLDLTTPPMVNTLMSEARFPQDTQKIVTTLKRLKPNDIMDLMGVSQALALLNYNRFQDFETQADMACAFMFDGDVYSGLKARELDLKALEFAQAHLRILSGLYGVLRPLDAIKPYRLEMGSSLKVGKSNGLYNFWGSKISDLLQADAKQIQSETIINLASHEYARAALTKTLTLQVISPRFLEIKDNQMRTLSFFAKKARGLMARFIIDQRLDRADGLKDFAIEGYEYRKDLSRDGDWVFTRAQTAKR